MTFIESIRTCFNKYTTFSGRASRSEYWYWVLFTFLAGICLSVLDQALFPFQQPLSPLHNIFTLAIFLPGLAVMMRRLHDTNRTGWWWLIAFTVVGLIPLTYWLCKPSDAGENRFGAPRVLAASVE